MDQKEAYTRLRLYCSSTDRLGGQPLYQAVVRLARDAGMHGASVFRGVMGFGASTVIHSSKLWEITEKLPMVIELVDTEEKIRKFFNVLKPQLEEQPKGVLVTSEPVQVELKKYGKGRTSAG